MGTLESRLMFGRTAKPLFNKRYIDDIFLLWVSAEGALHEYISKFNNLHPLASGTRTLPHLLAFRRKS